MSWLAAVTLATAAVTAYAQYDAGQTAKKQAQADADAEAANARLEAERIREQAKRTRSAATAQAAENGLNLNIGAPVRIDEQIAYDSEQDAWMTRITGQNRARSISAAGTNAATSANWQAGSTLLSSAASAYGGYKTNSGVK